MVVGMLAREGNERLIRRFFDAFVRGDREQAVAYFTEDAVFSYPGPGALHGEWRGRGGILEFWAAQDFFSGSLSS